MSRRLPVFAGAALLVLGLGLLAARMLDRLHPYTTTIDHGPAPEAAADPYLAAEHFLAQRGVTVRRADNVDAIARLPAPGQTLLLLGERSRMTPPQAERLLEWAAKGGHLLFVAERLYDEETGRSDDPLLDRLGIQQYLSEDLDEDDAGESRDEEAANEGAANEEAADPEERDAGEPPEADASKADSPAAGVPATGIPATGVPATGAPADEHALDPFPQLTKLYLENEEQPAYFSFDTDYHLYDSENRAHAWANSAAATHMLQLYHGEGLITVLSDPWIWDNERIGEYDNAWLLWYLSQDSEVTLLYRADHDDLFSLLLRHFPEALAALAMLAAALLWRVGRRQGPIIAPAPLARRQLQEHIRAGADFLLRRSGQQALLGGLQRDIQRRARRRHPGFERLPVAEQWQVLGRLTRLPSRTISQAMRPLPKQRLSAADFTRQVAHLQSLRNAL